MRYYVFVSVSKLDLLEAQITSRDRAAARDDRNGGDAGLHRSAAGRASSAAAWARDMLTADAHLSALAVADEFAEHVDSALLALCTGRR